MNIIGQGLAGSCLAWQAYWKGVDFRLYDIAEPKSSSLIAAGLVNPITGTNFNKSWEIDRFLPESKHFFLKVEQELNSKLWYDLEIVRLFGNEKSRTKALNKWEEGKLSPYAKGLWGLNEDHWQKTEGLLLKEGARVDVKAFVEKSRDYFASKGLFSILEEDELKNYARDSDVVLARGSVGLMAGDLKSLPHRCAKGEILTVRIPELKEERCVIDKGWLIPLGEDLYRVGATYEWETLDWQPSQDGVDYAKRWLDEHVRQDYEIVDHQAGIRPIVRTSIPLIRQDDEKRWILNGLGSKGSLYAPSLAEALLHSVIDESVIPVEFDANVWERGRFKKS